MAQIRQNIVDGQEKKRFYCKKNNNDPDNNAKYEIDFFFFFFKNIANILCITTEDFLLTHEKWDDS